ncbi:hypothetical protein [Methylocella sp.]
MLLGWPLLKLVATLISQPLWRRAKILAAQIKADESYGAAERARVDRTMAHAKGEPLQILMPVFVLAGGVAFAFTHPFDVVSMLNGGQSLAAENARQELLLQQEYREFEASLVELDAEASFAPKLPDGSLLWSDDRFERLCDLAFSLAALRYPVSSLLTALAALVVAPLIFVGAGLRASAWLVLRRLVLSSAYSSRIFARSVGVIS